MMPNKESFLDAIIKHEMSCNVGIGEKSLWQWICMTIQNYLNGPIIVKNKFEAKVRSAFKILVILTQSDNSNIEFLMNIGIAEFISEALGWNDPNKQGGTTSLVIEFDTYMNQIITNLVESQVNNFGDRLIDGGSQWILDRFSSRMSQGESNSRYESIRLLLSLVKQ